MPLTLVVAPAVEPVSLAEAKAWLRIDGTDEDALLPPLIQAARQAVERHACAALISQQWKWTIDGWPKSRVLVPPVGPMRSLDAVQAATGASGTLAAVPLTAFQADLTGQRGRIVIVGPVPAPATPLAGIAITLKAGLAAGAADLPPAMRQAVLMTLAHLHENRGDGTGPDGPVPPQARALLSPWRFRRL